MLPDEVIKRTTEIDKMASLRFSFFLIISLALIAFCQAQNATVGTSPTAGPAQQSTTKGASVAHINNWLILLVVSAFARVWFGQQTA